MFYELTEAPHHIFLPPGTRGEAFCSVVAPWAGTGRLGLFGSLSGFVDGPPLFVCAFPRQRSSFIS